MGYRSVWDADLHGCLLHRVGDENILQGAVRVAVQNGSQSSNRRQWRADCLREKMELVAAAQKLVERTVGGKRRDIGMLNNATISIIYGDG